jgi:hypothetical protein
MASRAEHVWVTHPGIDGATEVPVDALDHYADLGWERVPDSRVAAVAATGGAVEDYSDLTRQELLDRAMSQGLAASTHATKAELVGLLDEAAAEGQAAKG